MRTAQRRGNYSIMFGIAGLAMMGFGAFAVDLSLVRLAQGQAQTVADAASQAGLYVLRTTGSLTQARSAATRVVTANTVAGHPGTAKTIDFGIWDDGVYKSANSRQNAIKVTVSQTVEMPLASVFGVHRIPVEEYRDQRRPRAPRGAGDGHHQLLDTGELRERPGRGGELPRDGRAHRRAGRQDRDGGVHRPLWGRAQQDGPPARRDRPRGAGQLERAADREQGRIQEDER